MTLKQPPSSLANRGLALLDGDARALATFALQLHFFANRALVADAAALLPERGFGLLHLRILFFAHFAFGISVSELLALLRVTHQNLIRGLRVLVDEGFVEAKTCDQDRRVKRLHSTRKGAKLLAEVNGKQLERITHALEACSQRDREGYFRVLDRMVEPLDREWVERMLQSRQPTEGAAGLRQPHKGRGKG